MVEEEEVVVLDRLVVNSLVNKRLLKHSGFQRTEPNVPPFTGTPGIKVPLPIHPSAYNFLNLFLTDEFFDVLSEQTNLYATQYKSNNPNSHPHSHVMSGGVTQPEMK